MAMVTVAEAEDDCDDDDGGDDDDDSALIRFPGVGSFHEIQTSTLKLASVWGTGRWTCCQSGLTPSSACCLLD